MGWGDMNQVLSPQISSVKPVVCAGGGPAGAPPHTPSPQAQGPNVPKSITGPIAGWGAAMGLDPPSPSQGSASAVPESWNSDCLRRLSRAHLGQVVELS